MTSSSKIALSIRGAVKRFGNSQALDGVDLMLQQGTVLALLGANGSGKSTLIKALAGYHHLDAGTVRIRDDELNILHMREQGKAAGLRFVHQDLALIPSLSITDNIAFGRGFLTDRFGTIDWRREEIRVRRDLEAVGVAAGPDERVVNLGPVDQTLVAIVRALDHLETGRNLLVLDEPTARLPQEEASRLIARLRSIRQRGVSIIYVTHRLEEVYSLADAVVVLTDGRVSFSGDVSELPEVKLRALIAGIQDTKKPRASPPSSGVTSEKVVLELKDVSGRRLRDVSLKLHRGEVLGVTGLVGSGRSELGRILYGIEPYGQGEIEICGRRLDKNVTRPRPTDGMGYLPQDRRSGLFTKLSVQENIIITSMQRLTSWFGLQPGRLREAAHEAIRNFQIRPPEPDKPVGILSGGNQQKVALSKWLQLPLDILILDEPTQAIDVGTKEELMNLVRERAQIDGLAVLWLESDINELVRHASRIIVMNGGRVTAEFSESPFDFRHVLSEAYRMSGGAERGGEFHNV